MRVLAIVLGLGICVGASASERTEKIQVLMDAQGLTQTFEQQMTAGREQTKMQADQMLQQIMNGLRPNPEFEEKFKVAYLDFVEAMQAPWSSSEVVKVWAKYYGSRFTDSELDQLIAHYRSPLGQKEVIAGREAMAQFSAEFRERYQPIQQGATQAFIERIQQIVRECNCRK